MSTNRKKIELQLQEVALERPTFWEILGSKYTRAKKRSELMEHDEAEMKEALPSEFPEGGKFVLKQLEVLRPGVYNGIPFTPDMMREIVDFFNALDPPPVQADHSLSARDTHGRVLDLMLDESSPEGPRVVALSLFLGDYAVERVLDGRWNKFSAGLWLNPTWLEHLAITPFPACPTAAMLSKNTEETSKMEEEHEEGATLSAPDTEEQTEQEGETVEEESTEQPAESVELSQESELESVRAELAKLREEFAQAKAEKAETAVRAQLMNLVRSGHSSPDLHEREVKFAVGLSDEQRKEFISLRESMEKIWEPGRLSKPKPIKPGEQKAELADEKKALMANAGISTKSDA